MLVNNIDKDISGNKYFIMIFIPKDKKKKYPRRINHEKTLFNLSYVLEKFVNIPPLRLIYGVKNFEGMPVIYTYVFLVFSNTVCEKT